jgi:cupin superfamily acireductone dioxygenase involved in methionine salvage
MVHARLEQLRCEVLAVQRQQALLTSQRAELEAERQRLAVAISETEEEKRKLQAERATVSGIARKRQIKEKDEIQQLKKQV